jgi:predicted RNase H-like HicB family nuclease
VGIQIPDIPGAVTAGDTFEEAYDAAVEIVQILLQQMEAQGLDLPVPISVNKI